MREKLSLLEKSSSANSASSLTRRDHVVLPQESGMDGEQDAAVAGIVSTLFSYSVENYGLYSKTDLFFRYLMCMRRWNRFITSSELSTAPPVSILLWSPVEDTEWYQISCEMQDLTIFLGGSHLWVVSFCICTTCSCFGHLTLPHLQVLQRACLTMSCQLHL